MTGAKHRPVWSRTIVWLYFPILILLFCAFVFLWKSGDMLVRSNAPNHVRWAVVLAGEGRGMERSSAALNLFREGRFDSLILSGPRVFRDHHESEFSTEYLESNGFPHDRLFQLPHEANSTLSEAGVILKQAHLLGVDTLLIITSSFHSARALRIFRKLAGGVPVVCVAMADYSGFDPGAWWSSREGRVVWALEWAKTLLSAYELMNVKPMSGENGPLLLEPNPRDAATHATSVPLPLDSLQLSPSDSVSVAKDSIRGRDG